MAKGRKELQARLSPRRSSFTCMVSLSLKLGMLPERLRNPPAQACPGLLGSTESMGVFSPKERGGRIEALFPVPPGPLTTHLSCCGHSEPGALHNWALQLLMPALGVFDGGRQKPARKRSFHWMKCGRETWPCLAVLTIGPEVDVSKLAGSPRLRDSPFYMPVLSYFILWKGD